MNINKALSGGAFSAVFCAVAAPVYFTAHAAISTGEHGPTHIAIAFMNVAALAFIPAAAFGFLLGTIAAFVLGRALFRGSGRRRILVAAIIGAVFGCIPPSIPRVIHPVGNGDLLPFLPCVIIGVACAVSWALVQIRLSPLHTERLALR